MWSRTKRHESLTRDVPGGHASCGDGTERHPAPPGIGSGHVAAVHRPGRARVSGVTADGQAARPWPPSTPRCPWTRPWPPSPITAAPCRCSARCTAPTVRPSRPRGGGGPPGCTGPGSAGNVGTPGTLSGPPGFLVLRIVLHPEGWDRSPSGDTGRCDGQVPPRHRQAQWRRRGSGGRLRVRSAGCAGPLGPRLPGFSGGDRAAASRGPAPAPVPSDRASRSRFPTGESNATWRRRARRELRRNSQDVHRTSRGCAPDVHSICRPSAHPRCPSAHRGPSTAGVAGRGRRGVAAVPWCRTTWGIARGHPRDVRLARGPAPAGRGAGDRRRGRPSAPGRHRGGAAQLRG